MDSTKWGTSYYSALACCDLKVSDVRTIVCSHIGFGCVHAIVATTKEFAYICAVLEKGDWVGNRVDANTFEELVWMKLSQPARIYLRLEQVRKPEGVE